MRRGQSILLASTIAAMGCGGNSADSIPNAGAGSGAAATGSTATTGSPASGSTTSSSQTTGSGSGGSTPMTVGACDALPAAGQWQEITPTGVATSDGLALDPFDVGTIWLGADPTSGLGGLFKSTDCGATWNHVSTGINGSIVDGSHMWSMAFDPVDQGTIYVVGAYGPGGLWKSTNGGVDWVQLFPEGSEFAKTVEYNFVSNVSMDPHDHLHLVVGTHGDCAAPYAPVCQAESTDGGSTWTIMKIANPTGSWVERTGPYMLDATSWLFATEFNGIFLTTDHGATWNDVTPSGFLGASGGEFTNRPLTPSPTGNYYLPAFGTGLLTSPDGKSWSSVANAPDGTEPCLAMGDGNLYMSSFNGGDYSVASESDLSTWTTLPKPFNVGDNGRQGPAVLEYDESHHILYSSNFTGGVWRLVTR